MTFQSDFTRMMVGDEGRRAYSYKDSLGFDTIGIGRLCDKRKPGSGLSIAEQDYLFVNDTERIVKEIDLRMPWINDLDQARRAALMNMFFQMGAAGVGGFVNSLAAIRRRQWEVAAHNLKQSLWYRQTPARAARVIEQIRTGTWQFAI